MKSKQAADMIDKLAALQKEAAKHWLDYFRLERLRAERATIIQAQSESLPQRNRSQDAKDTTTESKNVTVRVRRVSDFIGSVDNLPNTANDDAPNPGNIRRLNRPADTTYYFQDRPIETMETYSSRRLAEIDSEIQAIERNIDSRLKDKLEVAKQNYYRAVETTGKWLGNTVLFDHWTEVRQADLQANAAHVKLAKEQEELAKLESRRNKYRSWMKSPSPAVREQVKAVYQSAGFEPKQLGELILEQRNRVKAAECNWHEGLENRNRIVRDTPKDAHRTMKKNTRLSLVLGGWGGPFVIPRLLKPL